MAVEKDFYLHEAPVARFSNSSHCLWWRTPFRPWRRSLSNGQMPYIGNPAVAEWLIEQNRLHNLESRRYRTNPGQVRNAPGRAGLAPSCSAP